MAWEGHTGRIEDPEEKKRGIKAAVGLLVATAEQCRTAGLPCEIVSCGGTLTYHHTATLPGVTEVQAGGGHLLRHAIPEPRRGSSHRSQSAGDGR